MKGSIKKDIVDSFRTNMLEPDMDEQEGLAAVKALMTYLEQDVTTTTITEFLENMMHARQLLCAATSQVAVRSSCELFVRFITMSPLDLEHAGDFEGCKRILLKEGEKYMENMKEKTNTLLKNCEDLIKTGMVILTHARSRNVLSVMVNAAKKGIEFTVYVTEAQPTCEGHRMARELEDHGIKCTLILDAAVGATINRITTVILGAEGICINGGIINKIGSYHVAFFAQRINRKVFVLAESYKFIQLLPLNSLNLPEDILYTPVVPGQNVRNLHPLVDYTPPDCITMLYTDLGELTTAAVAESLMDLFT